MPPLSPPCSDAARGRGDPMAGTAAPARAWFLIEHPGPWPADAFGGSGLSVPVQRRLQQAAADAGARILLVRRPGRRAHRSRRSWAVVHGLGSARPQAQVWGDWQAEGDLLDAVPALAGARDPRDGPPAARGLPLLLVCAHGRHDVCCAVRGRPVAAALQERWPEQTWECSHVGGCRFAGNVVVLPDGAYYGGLGGDDTVEVVGDHLAGRVRGEYLRGVSHEPPVAQAAIAELHRQGRAEGELFRSRRVEQVAASVWRVVLERAADDGSAGPVEVELEQQAAPEARLTCRAPRDATARTFVVRRVRPAP
ncbi:MAG TPA: sucrase ferredoxin [Segeticoccus sp.]|nr:sucrase ferredoxin [Segeticoccus sp.]